MSVDIIAATIALSSDNSPIWILAAGPAGAVGTYWAFYRYYRNTDKSHEFERDTLIKAQPAQGGEQKVDHISRTKRSRIEGGNWDDYRERVQRIP